MGLELQILMYVTVAGSFCAGSLDRSSAKAAAWSVGVSAN